MTRKGEFFILVAPTQNVAETWGVEKYPIPLPIGQYLAVGSDEFAPPGNYASADDLVDDVYDLIDAGVEPQVVAVDPKTLLATQDWLSNEGGGDPLFDEYPDKPVIYKKAGKLYILDGHHRTTRAWKAGRPISVYLFGDDQQNEQLPPRLAESIKKLSLNENTAQHQAQDLKDVAEWLNTTPDQLSIEVKQEPIEKFIKQIREMYGTYLEFPKDEKRTDRILKLLKRGADPLPIYVEAGDPHLFVMEGRHRMVAFWLAGMKTIPVAYASKKVEENFADGKNPGRKGLAKRMGVNTKASVSSLRKTAKNSSGEKQRMAHWLANMKAGRAK